MFSILHRGHVLQTLFSQTKCWAGVGGRHTSVSACLLKMSQQVWPQILVVIQCCRPDDTSVGGEWHIGGGGRNISGKLK